MSKTVKFLHPGPEWTSPVEMGRARWRYNTEDHSRRYLQVEGRYIRDRNGLPEVGPMGFWGEYEAQTTFRRLVRRPDNGLPSFVHTPDPLADVRRPIGALNTDPLVLGSHWLYSNCRQRSIPRLHTLRRGDVVVFGSLVGGVFVIDTVFVVADRMRYAGGRAARTAVPGLPDHAYRLVLDLVEHVEHILYIGATYDAPVNDLFSFVPAVSTLEHPEGFARPTAPPSLQSLQPLGAKFLDDPVGYWTATALTVLGQGLCLGVHAALSEPVAPA